MRSTLDVAHIPSINFMSLARVAYCQPLGKKWFAIGVQFLEPTDKWVVRAVPGAEESAIR